MQIAMAKSIGDQLKAIQKQSMTAAEKVYKETMFELSYGVIFDTPVLDGFLIGGWLSGYSFDNEQHNDTGAAESTGRLSTAVESLTLDKSFYFINPLPYAYRIEYEGHSKRRPEGMLRKNLREFENVAQDKINKYKV